MPIIGLIKIAFTKMSNWKASKIKRRVISMLKMKVMCLIQQKKNPNKEREQLVEKSIFDICKL